MFFCLLAGGGAALAAGALAFGWSRGDTDLPPGPFITALILFAFLNTGFVLGIWLLFDENVAKPISRLSAELRLRAHAGVERDLETEDARHLGDLAPAAQAISQKMERAASDNAAAVAAQTRRLQADAERLTALLSQIPIATILLNPAREIVLYDAQAAELLTPIAAPRLKARLSDYFDLAGFDAAVAALQGTPDTTLMLPWLRGGGHYEGRLKSIDESVGWGGFMINIDMPKASIATPARSSGPTARPLVYDFDLLNPATSQDLRDTRLRDLCFVAFDTETTGLSVTSDDIIQIGAVRVVGGRIIEGEVIDTFVDPGRPIPPASTAIHHIHDADVAGACDIVQAGQSLFHFTRDAVLVAHNAPFDIGLLRKDQGRMGVKWTHPVLDTVLLSAVIFGTTEDHTLDALCARLNVDIPPERRHTALGDAQATAEVLVRLLPLLEGLGLTTLGQLISRCQKHGRLLQDMNT